MPYRENSLYVTLEEAVDEIARVYYPTNHYEAADDFTQACKDGKLKTLFEASHQEVGGWEWRQGHQSVHSCNLIVRRADLLVIYPDLWKELSSKTANPAKGEYVYNKTTKRIEFRSPVDAESLAAGAVRPSRAGRKKGSGSLDSKDAPLLDEMQTLVENEEPMSVWDATLRVVDRAPGTDKTESKRKRLAKKYKDRHGLR